MAGSPESGYPRPGWGPRILIRKNAQAKSEQDGESSASGANLSFGAVDPRPSADCNAVGHSGTEGADGRREEKRRAFVPVES